MKFVKVGCISIFGLIIFIFALGFIFGGSNTTDKNKNESISKDMIIDANQFSRISGEELMNIMGEPDSIEDFEWSIPKTGESIVGEIYIYEQNKYEFLLFDNAVRRLNVYSGISMGYDDSKLEFEKEEDLFDLFNIEPNSYLKKVADTNYALRYTPVSDKVAELWILEIENHQFGTAKITYDLNYF